MNKVLVIGSSNIDYLISVNSFPKEGETIHANSLNISLGGKGLNQAIATKKTNANVSFVTALGNDSNKDIVINYLNSNNIDYKIINTNDTTGSAYIFINNQGENEIVVNGGANLKIKLQDIDNIKDLILESDYILLQLEINLDIIKYIIDIAYENKKTIILNPAPYKHLDLDLLRKIDYITPNQNELKDLSDNYSHEYLENAKHLISKGVKNIIVTLGKNGSCLINKDITIKIEPTKVTPRDTTGAGDCYNGFFVGLLSLGYDIKSSLQIASKAAAISTLKNGAAISYPNIEEILKNC